MLLLDMSKDDLEDTNFRQCECFLSLFQAFSTNDSVEKQLLHVKICQVLIS